MTHHLSGAIFVKDLSRLFVVPIRHFRTLVPGEYTECVDRKLRFQKEGLISGDDRVTAEESGEPRNAGCDHMLIPVRNQQRMEVTGGGSERSSVHLIATRKLGDATFPTRIGVSPRAAAVLKS